MRVTGSIARPESRSGARLFWGICAAGAAVVLALARVLSPDPSGLGTHMQLGLPACPFFALTSLPCPACGLTTSFAHMARLQITPALHANVLGVPLCVLTAASLPLCSFACARALPILPTIELLRLSRVAAIIGVAALLGWIARIAAILLL